MTPPLTPNEAFLVDFHDRRAGATTQAYLPLRAGKAGGEAASSYAFLADLVQQAGDAPVVLDMACGDGYLLQLLAELRPGQVFGIGIDLSRGELAAARRRLGPRAALVRSRAQALPLPGASVDLVLCHMALMLMDELDRVLCETRRVLRRGGCFSFIVGARPPPSPALDLMLQALRAARQRGAVFSPALGDRRLGHVDRIVPLLSSAHFDAVTVDDITLTRPCTPRALWQWFEGMYDMHGMRAEDKARLRDDYLQAVQPLCDAQGCIVHTDVLRQVRATAA